MNVQAFFHPRSQLCCAVCGRVPGMCCFPSDPVAVSWITCHFSLCPAGPAVVPSLIVLCSLFFFSLSVLWAPPVYRAIVFHLLRNTKTPVCSEWIFTLPHQMAPASFVRYKQGLQEDLLQLAAEQISVLNELYSVLIHLKCLL